MIAAALAGGLGGGLGEQLITLGEVLMMDLVLAGDNAVAVGLAAAGLAADQRKRAILLGLIVAVVLRIGLALITVQLLAVVGLLLAGGVLLLWVCWKMARELKHQAKEAAAADPAADAPTGPRKSFAAALFQITIADATMSLDNVLAVAGAAHEHPVVMVIGLLFSIALMGVAATYIAGLLQRFRWIGWLGLVIVLYVALHMIWDGGRQIIVRTGRLDAFNAAAPDWADIGPEEAAHHRGQRRSAESPLPAPAGPSVL